MSGVSQKRPTTAKETHPPQSLEKYEQTNPTHREKTRRRPTRGAATNSFNISKPGFLHRWTAAVRQQGYGRNRCEWAGPDPNRPGADRNRPAADPNRPAANGRRQRSPARFGRLCEEAVRTARLAGI